MNNSRFTDDEEQRIQQMMSGMSDPGQQRQQSSGGGMGSFLLNLLPGGSLIDKGMRGQSIGAGDILSEVGLSLLPFGIGKAAKGIKGAIKGGKAASGAARGAGSAADLPIGRGRSGLDEAGDFVNTQGRKVGDKSQSVLRELAQEGVGVSSAKPSRMASRLQDTGGKLLASQSKGALSGRMAEQAPDVYRNMSRYGYRNPDEFADVASKVTGRNGVMNLAKFDILESAPKAARMNPKWQSEALESAVNKNPDLVGNKALQDRIRGTLRGVDDNIRTGTMERAGLHKFVGPDSADVGVMYGEAQKLQSLAYESLGRNTLNTATPLQRAQFEAYNSAADSIKRQVDKAIGSDPIPTSVKQEVMESLTSQGINSPKLLKEVQDARTLKDWTKIESQFVQASKIGEETASAANRRGISAPTDLRSSTLTGMVAEPVANIGSRLAGGAAVGLGDRLAGTAVRGAQEGPGMLGRLAGAALPGVNTPLGRIGYSQAGVRLPQAMEAGKEEPQIDPQTGMPIEGDPQMMGMMDPMGGMGQGMGAMGGDGMSGDSQSQYPIENLIKDIEANPGQASTLMAIYELMNPEPEKLSAAEKKSQRATESALGQLDLLENSLSGISGGMGPVFGRLSQLGNILTGGALNPEQATYDAAIGGLSAQFLRALGETGAMSDKDIERAQALMPRSTDSPQSAQQKMAQLRALVSNAGGL